MCRSVGGSGAPGVLPILAVLVLCLAGQARGTVCESYASEKECTGLVTESGRCQWTRGVCTTILGELPPGMVAITENLGNAPGSVSSSSGGGARSPSPPPLVLAPRPAPEAEDLGSYALHAADGQGRALLGGAPRRMLLEPSRSGAAQLTPTAEDLELEAEVLEATNGSLVDAGAAPTMEMSLSSVCMDQPAGDGYTCAQQREWGKCGQPWMIQGGFCRKTCGVCTAAPPAPPPPPPRGSPTEGSFCNLPADTGPCKQTSPRWYFDAGKQKCSPFVWGGCDGNANNFPDFSTCSEAASTVCGAPQSAPQL